MVVTYKNITYEHCINGNIHKFTKPQENISDKTYKVKIKTFHNTYTSKNQIIQ